MHADYTAIPLTSRPHKTTQPNFVVPHQPSSTQSLLSDAKVKTDDANHQQKAWVPLMLRPWVLLMISLAILVLIVSLEIVNKIADQQHGFGPVDSSLVYVWTYGPTAVFTLVAAFWTQIDYRTRHMQPWIELAKGPQPASKNLFLDYISPNPLSSFIRSLKHRHWPVALVLLGSLFLKIVIVLSTGLFVPHFGNLPISTRIEMVQQFQFESFNASIVDASTASLLTSLNLKEVDYPFGTNSEFVAERFRPYNNVPSTSFRMNATVKTITAGLECNVASVNKTVKNERVLNSVYLEDITMAATTDDCRISQFPTKNRTMQVQSTRMGKNHSSWYGDLFFERCDGDGTTDDLSRIVVVILHKDTGPTLTNSTALFCKPYVNMSYSTVTLDHLGALIGAVPSSPLPLPSSLSADRIHNGIQKTLDSIRPSQGYGPLGSSSGNSDLQPFINLILLSQNSRSAVDATDPNFLIRGATAAYRGLVTQLAKQYMLVANSSDTGLDHKGSISYNHQRLFVQHRTLRLIEAILGCVFVILLVLVFQRTPSHLLQDTTSIARLASTLRHSNGLNESFRGTGSWSIQDLETAIQGKYRSRLETTQNDSHSKNEMYVVEGDQQAKHHTVGTAQQHWRPMTLSWYARAGVLLVPLGLVVALEIMFQRSQRSDGLLEVINLKDAQLGTALVPAVVMASTKFLFSVFDFDLRIIDPYAQLKKAAASVKSAVLDQTIYTWKTDAFWIAIKSKRFAVGASTLSVMLASFLTVAVSGLFVMNPVGRESHVDVVRMDTFSDFSQVATTVNETTKRTARLAAYGLLNNPIGVYQSYAVPMLSLSPSSPGPNMTTIVVQTSVRGGRLNCTLVPRDKVTVQPLRDNYLNVQWPEMTAGCTGQQRLNASETWTSLIGFDNGTFATWKPGEDTYNKDCPIAWAMYGIWSGNSTAAADINIVQCWSELHEADASVHFSLPGWAIETLSIHEQTTKMLGTGSPSHVKLPSVFNDPSTSAQGNIGPCFSNFLRSTTPNTLDMHLLQRENFGQLYARIQTTYGVVVAHTLTAEGRSNGTVDAQLRTLNGTATSHTLRLQQSRVSTIILQGLLAGMFVCALVSVSMLRLTGMLPKNPCSIAAQASLVAGSRMLADIPPEAQGMGEREFEKLFVGKRYLLGWSRGADGEERFGVDKSE